MSLSSGLNCISNFQSAAATSNDNKNINHSSANGGYIVPVEVKFIDERKGHGVFATNNIAKGTLLWTPALVTKIPKDDVAALLRTMTPDMAHIWFEYLFYNTYILLLCMYILCATGYGSHL